MNKQTADTNNVEINQAEQLKQIAAQLSTINRNLLNVFRIVGFFALLYFGLMIYMMFYR